MKKLLLATTLFIGSIIHTSADAQVRVSFNMNINSQPIWGPVGYDYAQYYYLPDIDAYYDVSLAQFVFFDAGRWAYARTLPARYRNYNLYSGYKVVINQQRPYMYHNVYRSRYSRYRNYHGHQTIICNSRDQRYVIVNRNRNGYDRDRDRNFYHDNDFDHNRHNRR